MIDIQILRDDPDRVRENCRRRGAALDVDRLIAVDRQWRDLNGDLDRLRHEQKELSRRAAKDTTLRDAAVKIKNDIKVGEARAAELDRERQGLLDLAPNFLAPDVPDGASDADNVEIRRWGEQPAFAFKPREHDELGRLLGILDTEAGAKVAGAGFYYWKGDGARLLWALFHFAWDYLVAREFTPFFTPIVARPATLYGTGYLPFFAGEIYGLKEEALCLIGTSEQTLVGYRADELIPAAELPLRYMAFTPCFRTEAGAHGRETRGIFRVHQFHKIEQIVFCLPEESERWHAACQENEEGMLQALGVPYRVVAVCSGDLGAPGWKKYDCEAYFAGFGAYREVTSNTNLTDYQTRRLKIRFKGAEGKGFPHTISATGVTDRVAVAILENNQREDGSVAVPEALRPYMRGQEIISPHQASPK
jgi:seryl-tRNA synthetase